MTKVYLCKYIYIYTNGTSMIFFWVRENMSNRNWQLTLEGLSLIPRKHMLFLPSGHTIKAQKPGSSCTSFWPHHCVKQWKHSNKGVKIHSFFWAHKQKPRILEVPATYLWNGYQISTLCTVLMTRWTRMYWGIGYLNIKWFVNRVVQGLNNRGFTGDVKAKVNFGHKHPL